MATKKRAATRLVIVRRRWLRGEGAADSYLRRASDGRQCCLGFYARVCGIKAKTIVGEWLPGDVREEWPEDAQWLFDGVRHSADATSLADINDNSPDEKKIARLFAKHGVKVVFR